LQVEVRDQDGRLLSQVANPTGFDMQ
jgi:hypothetical protein